MINAKINNQSVEGINTLTIIRRNPMLNDMGASTLPFSLPNTPINCRATGIVDEFQSIPETEPDAEIEIFNEPYMQGSAIFESSGSTLGGYIMAGKSHFYSLIKDKNLRDLQCEGVRFPVLAGYSDEIELCAQTLTMCLSFQSEICDILAFPVCMRNTHVHLNAWDFSTGDFAAQSTYLCPFLRLTAVLRFIFSEAGYLINENAIMDDAEYKQMVVFNNVPTGSLNYEPDLTTSKIWGSHLPDYSIKSFLSDVETLCNVTFNYDNTKKQVDIVKNGDVLTQIATNDLDEYRTSIIAKKRITNKSGRSWSWAQPDDDDYFVSTDLTDIVITSEVSQEKDLPAASSANADQIFLAQNTSTLWRCKEGGTEDVPTYTMERFGTLAGSLKTGLGSYDRSMGLVPLPMFIYERNNQYDMLMPRTDQDQVLQWNAKHRDFAPSILFYRGMVEVDPLVSYSGSTSYPLGSIYKKDVFGNDIQGLAKDLATESLENDDPLLNSWYDNAREQITFNVDLLPWSVYRNIKILEKQTLRGLDFIIDNDELQADTLGVDSIKITAYRC